MKKETKSITFYYPTTLTGGAQYLFVRLANYLTKLGKKVYYIDYKNGFSRNLLNDEVEKIDCIKNKKLTLDYETTLILAPSQILQIKNYLNLSEKVKLFFYGMHHYNFLYLFPFFIKYQKAVIEKNVLFLNKYYPKEYSLMKTLVKDLYAKNNLVFIDQTNYRTNNTFFEIQSDKKNYLPIPLEETDCKINKKTVDKTELNICWLGNLVDFKAYPLLNIIENADKYCEKYDKKIKLHIIGEGPEKSKIQEHQTKNNVEIVFKGTLMEKDLNDYLLSNADILFAMGTSCLEGAKLSIATVIADPSYHKVSPEYKYKWLFETTDFALGDFVSEAKGNAHDFEGIITAVCEENGKSHIGEKCYEYFKNNHSIKAVCDKLLDYLEQSSDISINYFEKSGLYKTKLQYFALIWKGLSIIKTFLRLNKG